MQVAISKAKGSLVELVFKRGGFGRWNAGAGRLTIVDGITNAVYSDEGHDCSLVQSVRRA